MPGVGKANPAAPLSTATTGEKAVPDGPGDLSLAQAVQPYAPSWIDRLTAWVERLPGPVWAVYMGLALVFIAARTLIAWSDGAYAAGTLFPAHILDAASVVYLLAALHYLDDRAGAALATFRPVLAVDEASYERLRYELTTMPARPVIAWSVVGAVFGTANVPFLLSEAQREALRYFTSPAAAALDIGLAGLGWMLMAVFTYHTVHQLRLVSRIYTHHTNVNIFESGPLYALSRVSAMTAVALIFITYLYLTVWFNWQFDSAVDASLGLAFIFIGLATFVLPLLGAHRILQEEKAKSKMEVAQRMKAATGELHRRTDAGDYSDMANMDHAIDGLIKEQNILNKMSTWPWEPESIRVVVTALLLPVVLWITTRILERFVGF